MIELRWKVSTHTQTAPPKLQYRIAFAVDASGAFCPGVPGEWIDVPTIPVAPEPDDGEHNDRA